MNFFRLFFIKFILFLCMCALLHVILLCFLPRRTMGLIKLKSSDSKVFEVDRVVLKNFKMIEEMLDVIGLNEQNINVIPIKQINSTILEIILKWAEHQQQQMHTEQSTDDELSDQLSEFEQKFVDSCDEKQIFEIINAARFLGAEALSDMLIKEIAKKCSTKPTDHVRDFTEISKKKSRYE